MGTRNHFLPRLDSGYPLFLWTKNYHEGYIRQRSENALGESLICIMFLSILLAAWIAHVHVASFNVSISQEFGADNTSCFQANETLACKSINYALGILNDVAFDEENTFIFSIRDKHYDLRTQVRISQSRADRHIFITTADNSRAIVRCGFDFSTGIVIGSQAQSSNALISTKSCNIHLSNLEFEQFSANSAAVVLIWNSENISFTNCVFRDNKCSGINAFDSGVAVERCLFTNNTSNVLHTTRRPFTPGLTSVSGGAGFVFQNAEGLSVIVRDSNFTGNSAAVNNSENYIPPNSISVVPELNYLGGGLLVAFLSSAKSNRALVENTVIANNEATFGGGLFHCSNHFSEGNLIEIRGSTFTGNRASQAGGGLSISIWDSSEVNAQVKDTVISDNWSRRGGGLNVFLMKNYFRSLSPSLLIQFYNLTLDGNSGRASAAVRLDTALPVGFPINVVPEFHDCTIMNHGATYETYTAPFTSQRVNAQFLGRNVFMENHGAGAMEYQEGVIHVNGSLQFIRNSGSHGGAVLLRSSQVTLYPGSELRFSKNFASGVGGAIMAQTRPMYEFIHEYNPDCLVVYSERRTKPSEWKVSPESPRGRLLWGDYSKGFIRGGSTPRSKPPSFYIP